MWDTITYPFTNFHGAVVEVCEGINKFISTLYWAYGYLTMQRLKLIHIKKMSAI